MRYRFKGIGLLANGLLLLNFAFAAPTPKSPFQSKDITTASSELPSPVSTKSPTQHLDIVPKFRATERPILDSIADIMVQKISTAQPNSATLEPRIIATTKEFRKSTTYDGTTEIILEPTQPISYARNEITHESENATNQQQVERNKQIDETQHLKEQQKIDSIIENSSVTIQDGSASSTEHSKSTKISGINQNNSSSPLNEDIEVLNEQDELLANTTQTQMFPTSFDLNIPSAMNATNSPNQDTFDFMNLTDTEISNGMNSTNRQVQYTNLDTEEISTPTSWSSTFELADDDEKMNDTLFDVVIGDHLTNNFSQSTNTSNKLLEVDSEEFFVPADLKERETTPSPPSTQQRRTENPQFIPFLTDTVPPHSSTVNQDTADTIFYISNTEVKVREVQPTTNTNQELQFFPAAYQEDVIIDVHRKNYSSWDDLPNQYSEDLIVSKQQQQQMQQKPQMNIQTPGFIYEDADSVRSLDAEESISYMGESYIEVREFSRDAIATEMPIAQHSISNSNFDYVIIQPLPMDSAERTTVEPPIGVPVIEVLPPALIRQFTTTKEEETNQKIAAIPDLNEQLSLVENSNSENDEEMMTNFMPEPNRPLHHKSVPTKRNGATPLTNSTKSEIGNDTAAEVRNINEEFSLWGGKVLEHIVFSNRIKNLCFSDSETTAHYVFKCITYISPILFIAVMAGVIR